MNIRNFRDAPPAVAGHAGPAAELEPDITANCLDDVTLPPGGRPRISGVVQGPEPCYVDERGRDLRIDLLRGYFVVAMIVDHLRGPSPFYLVTGGNRFYTSAAEGFILTSGLVAGLVYGRLIQRSGTSSALGKVLSRAANLFLLTIGLTLLLLPISELLYLPWAQGVDHSNPLAILISVLTLHQTYYLVDVLLLYTILFIIAPLAFLLLERGQTWVVLGGSWLLWGLYQFFPQYTALPWQVIFFTGLVMGYHQERLPMIGHRQTRIALVITGIALLALIGVYFVVDTPTTVMPADIAAGSPVYHGVRLWLQDNIFAKVDLRPGRIVASAVTFTFLFLATTVFWNRLQRAVGWLLLPLGQHALYAYAAHVILSLVLGLIVAGFQAPPRSPQWVNGLVQIGGVMLIWFLVQRQFLSPAPVTRRYYYAGLAALAIGGMVALRLDPSPSHPGLGMINPEPPVAEARVPRRFGTPIPREALPPKPGAVNAASAPALPPTPTPTPNLPWKSVASADAITRLGEYYKPIQGSLDERWFYSPELDRDMPYWIYLPADYGLAKRRYPVLYMLHGLGGHRDEWIVYGLIDVADQQIEVGSISPMIIVLPQGDKAYWVNHTNNGSRWGEYLIRDLIPHVDATYRTLRAPQSRAIGGLSMGGWGALHHGFLHPDLFRVVGAHSVALRSEDDPTISFLGRGEEFRAKDPTSLARSLPGLDKLQIWIDMAEGDPWVEPAKHLHLILAGRGIPHIWQVYPGIHEYTYWEEHTVDYLRFYDQALARQ